MKRHSAVHDSVDKTALISRRWYLNFALHGRYDSCKQRREGEDISSREDYMSKSFGVGKQAMYLDNCQWPS